MLATIWMCTHEWSLMCIRATAFTLDACHHALSCVSSLTRSSIRRSFRLPRTGTLIFISLTACAGVRRVSRSASSETGWSIRSSVSRSSSTASSLERSARRVVAAPVVLVPDGLPAGRSLRQDGSARFCEPVVDHAHGMRPVRKSDRTGDTRARPEAERRVRRSEELREQQLDREAAEAGDDRDIQEKTAQPYPLTSSLDLRIAA